MEPSQNRLNEIAQKLEADAAARRAKLEEEQRVVNERRAFALQWNAVYQGVFGEDDSAALAKEAARKLRALAPEILRRCWDFRIAAALLAGGLEPKREIPLQLLRASLLDDDASLLAQLEVVIDHLDTRFHEAICEQYLVDEALHEKWPPMPPLRKREMAELLEVNPVAFYKQLERKHPDWECIPFAIYDDGRESQLQLWRANDLALHLRPLKRFREIWPNRIWTDELPPKRKLDKRCR